MSQSSLIVNSSSFVKFRSII